MKILVLMEWDIPKDAREYSEYMNAKLPFWRKTWDKYQIEISSWQDGTGTIVNLNTMEADTYSKVLEDEELQIELIRLCRTVDNARMRVLRPELSIPPEGHK